MNKNTHKIKNTNLRLICCPLKYSKEMKPEENNQNTKDKWKSKILI